MVDKMLKAIETTRYKQYTVNMQGCGDLVILVEAHPQHDWLGRR
jgi:hypothetical protein